MSNRLDEGRDLTTSEVLERMRTCVEAQKPFSLARLGSSELIVLAQDVLYPAGECVRRWPQMRDPAFEANGGVLLPNLRARDELAAALRRATILGVFRVSGSHEDEWGELTRHIFEAYGFRPPDTCYAYVNVWAIRTRLFFQLFRDCRVLIAGKRAAELATVLEERYGFRRVVGTVPLAHYGELPAALATVRQADYDLGLFACGVAADVLAVAAADAGRVGFDFGHALADVVRAHREGRYAWEGFEA
ncbi:MAG: hypothetical protein IRY95_01980 [Clostridia bacterium]|nr:hypothetical protein [Clostridia bacterium]